MKSCCQSSNRMCLILAPTANVCKKLINYDYSTKRVANFCVSEYKEMVKFLRLCSYERTAFHDVCERCVIIAWEHDKIPELLAELVPSNDVKDWPHDSRDRFDLLFIVDNPFTASATVTIETQNLGLPGDSDYISKKFFYH